MPVYSRTVDYIRFDATTATLTINVTGFSDGVAVTNTGEIPCVLPVSPAGSVPTGQDLVDFVEAFAAGIVQPAVIDSAAYLTAAGGAVTNAQDVYALTAENEPAETGGLSGDGIPVIIFPDRVYTPSGSVFTRSVIAPLYSYTGGAGRFPSAYEISVRLGTGSLDNGNVYSDPWPPQIVDTTLRTSVSGPITSFEVTNPAGIVNGMVVFVPTSGTYAVVAGVVGYQVNLTSAITVTPNFVSGTALRFQLGSSARLQYVFDDNYVWATDPTPATVAVSAFGSGVVGITPSDPIPAYIQSAYPTVFGGDAMIADQANPGFNLDNYTHYYYVLHEPVTITSTTGYAWFLYS